MAGDCGRRKNSTWPLSMGSLDNGKNTTPLRIEVFWWQARLWLRLRLWFSMAMVDWRREKVKMPRKSIDRGGVWYYSLQLKDKVVQSCATVDFDFPFPPTMKPVIASICGQNRERERESERFSARDWWGCTCLFVPMVIVKKVRASALSEKYSNGQ